jgi:exodeoxyribonuclease V
MPTLSPQQDRALCDVREWLRSTPGQNGTPQIFRLFGYAGSGKTTLAKHFAEAIDGEVKFAAFTGKAALALRRNGCHAASTIHRLIYSCRAGPVPLFELKPRDALEDTRLIILDECSMVSRQLGRDLLSFGVPVLALGDPAQLPPVYDERTRDQPGGFFTDQMPDVMLTEIHRQALNSPIIRLSMAVREGESLIPGSHGAVQIIRRRELDPRCPLETDQILVGRNNTRRAYNVRVRQRLGLMDPLPMPGDKLVCLRNNHGRGLLNGAVWVVRACSQGEDAVSMCLVDELDQSGSELAVSARIECFLGGFDKLKWEQCRRHEVFDFGYCLTTHKSQGSQWPSVVLFDESWAFRQSGNDRRWLYTGITRAAEKLTVVV